MLVLVLVVASVWFAAGCSGRKARQTDRPGATPSIVVSDDEWDHLLQSRSLADVSTSGLLMNEDDRPRIPSRIVTEKDTSQVVFHFGNREHRVTTLSGGASVLTDGNTCAVVDEDQCGDPVRIVKLDKQGKTLFEISEYTHAHSVECYSPKRGLIYIWVFEPGEIWAYRWSNGAKAFTIKTPLSQKPVVAVGKDERFLYFRYDKGHLQKKDSWSVIRYDTEAIENAAVVDNVAWQHGHSPGRGEM